MQTLVKILFLAVVSALLLLIFLTKSFVILKSAFVILFVLCAALLYLFLDK